MNNPKQIEFATKIDLNGFRVDLEKADFEDIISIINSDDKMLEDFVKILRAQKIHPGFSISFIQLLIRNKETDVLDKMNQVLEKNLTKQEKEELCETPHHKW